MTDRQPQGRWKGIQYDYDALLAADDSAACLYCLSDRDVQLILASLEFFAWKTRYFSLSNTPIDQGVIFDWQGHLGASLMTCIAIRQDPDNACLLQQQDEAGDWTSWANLLLCPPHLKIVNGVTVIVMPDNSIIMPTEDDSFDGRDVSFTPPARGGGHDVAICLACANAVNVLYNLHAQVFDKVFVPTATWVGLTLVAVIVGLLAMPVALAIIVSVIIAGGGVAILSGIELADFTTDVQQQLRCILLSHATYSSGVVTFDFAAVQSDVEALISGINIWAAINLYLSVIGEAGLNRAGATTEITDFDCACFPTAYEWDFTVNDGMFVYDSEVASTGGTYVGGASGYEKASTGISHPLYDCGRKSPDFDIPSTCHITRISTTQDADHSFFDVHMEAYIGVSRSAGLGQDPHIYLGDFGTAETATGDISNQSGVHVTFQFASQLSTGSFYTIRIDWTGDPPTGLSGGNYVS